MANEEKTIQFIPVENLRFDPENPRLPTGVDVHDGSAVLAWMLNDATIIELMGSIGQQGYFPGEPLLCVPVQGQDAGDYLVVEGNRRLAAVVLLLEPELAKVRRKAVLDVATGADYRPELLPALVFQDRGEILDYLGYRHITGIKEWDPLAKARYLWQLARKYEGRDQAETFRELAKTIGSRGDYVARLLTGLALYDVIAENDFFGLRGLDETAIKFSLLTTALTYNNIVSFLGLGSSQDPNLRGIELASLERLTSWMFERGPEGNTRVGESRNLSDLSAVVASEEALKYFNRGMALEDAAMLTEMPTQIFQKMILQAKDRLEIAQKHLHRVDNPTAEDMELLVELMQLIRDMRTIVRERLETEEV